ncbi:molybdopterin-dependent oxidoreductase [Limimaricola pyoseonensis]|uniref:Oxidoreductase molybdopterin-binding domain-containing protein n=1 Tax=Limimaricola pyoseonensis TaxID=521013 RepID=A0A1G7I8G8_9RHOB|nr:molybdopterin-dependent oxidoreductase [Limimaricola pyoseonensis]SDF08985.1 hypothetical protein SAMN04488567_3366 [Limimaricola pyoseonensis]
MPFSTFRAGLIAALLGLPLGLQAEPGPPAGEVLLTVTGLPDGTPARLDRAALAALSEDAFTTTTIWTDGPQRFEGVSLHDLLAALEVTPPAEAVLRVSAVNDYAVDIPLSDARDVDGPIVAHLHNGAPLPRRGNGPLWIVYPYDADPDWRTEVAYARSVWQLDRIELVDPAR